MHRNDSTFTPNLKQWIEMLKSQLQQNQDLLINSINFNNFDNEFHKYWQPQAHRDYLEILFDFQNQALDLLYLKIDERITEGKLFKNFREFYELWIDCCESIHEKLISTDQYQNTYSQYINAILTYMQNLKNSDSAWNIK